jgi:TetR/AcrR family transcriptional repressor of bet genes
MSRKSNTEQRRSEITAAMLIVLAEQGYERATIQAIAKQAQLAPGLIHYHFKTKAEILMALISGLTATFQARYETLGLSALSPREKLLAYINARLAKGDGANPEAVAAWVIIGAEAVKQPEVRALYEHAISQELIMLQDLLKAYLKAKGKPIKSASHLAAVIIATMEGAFQLASAAEAVMPKAYAAKTVIVLVERFIELEDDV